MECFFFLSNEQNVIVEHVYKNKINVDNGAHCCANVKENDDKKVGITSKQFLWKLLTNFVGNKCIVKECYALHKSRKIHNINCNCCAFDLVI